ncbi:metal-dependent hydrolase family protein [Hydrotalea sandarakina]|nr:amidohydrolase family protein [Hydrotalea sandarakina]
MKKMLLFALLFYQAANAQKTIIYCGKLIDVKNLSVQQGMSVIIQSDTVADIQKGYVAPASGDKVIDLKKYTVMPGLIDAHVHLESQTSPDAMLKRLTQNPADIAFQAAVYAKTTLMAGFTTVRDVGGSGVNISLRNAINKGEVIGPRIFTAGSIISTTGGHGDPTNGLREDLMMLPQLNENVVNGDDECRKAVRQHYKDGADLIKITATGGVLSLEKDGAGAQFTEDEIKTIVETAKDYGMRVAAHAHGPEGMKRAVLAGVTSIEHGTYMTPEIMELMKERGTYLVPTIIAGKSVADSAAKMPGYFPPIIRAKALQIGSVIQGTFAKAYKAGVKIAFGTDAGVYNHGKNWMEFGYMHEAGMPVLECIKAATVNAADLIGDTKIGSLEKGKMADVVAVDGDPVQDVKVMGKVVFVMKAGKVYKSE